MDIGYIQKLLVNTQSEKIILTDKVKLKIEIHGLTAENVLAHLKTPKNLLLVQGQEARRQSDRTFRLIFKESENKKIIVVVTEKVPEKEIYIVTAFPSTKKAEKLIRKQQIRRR